MQELEEKQQFNNSVSNKGSVFISCQEAGNSFHVADEIIYFINNDREVFCHSYSGQYFQYNPINEKDKNIKKELNQQPSNEDKINYIKRLINSDYSNVTLTSEEITQDIKILL
jgi:hypothetical protein